MMFDPRAGEPVGEFEVTNGKIMVTDPCYERGTWCQGILENAKNGTWGGWAYIEDMGKSILGGERVKAISIQANGTDIHTPGEWLTASFEVGVDSGQAGFFNEELYPDGEPGEYGDTSTFYGRACEQTHNEKDRHQHAGSIKEGIVSSSGYGDGGYTCQYYKTKDGEIIAAQIVFIEDENDEDEEPLRCLNCGTKTEDLDHEEFCPDCRLEECEECGKDFPAYELNHDLICNECRSGQNKNEDEHER